MRFSDMSLNVKVVGFIALLGATALGGAGYSAYQMIQIDRSYQGLLDGEVESVSEMIRASREISNIRLALFQNVASSTDADKDLARSDREKAEANFAQRMADAGAAYPQGKANIDRLAAELPKLMSGVCGDVVRSANAENQDGGAQSLRLMLESCNPPTARSPGQGAGLQRNAAPADPR